MSWKNIPSNIEDYAGFVYIIKHKTKDTYYIGKKVFWKRLRRKPLKGKKRVRICKVESDWKTYWGSSDKFKEYVSKEGEENFVREIIHLCTTKSEMSYIELLKQVEFDVLNDNNSFNGIIHVRLNRTK